MWPNSLSDYKWPRGLESIWNLPRRWMLASIFHASHAAGRLVSYFKPTPPAVLAIRTDGIGDGLLGEPMLSGLIRRFPGCQLHLWAPEATCDLLRAAPYLHRRLSIPRGFKEGNLKLFRSRSLRAKFGYHLGRWKFQTVAYLAHSPEPLGNWLFVSARAQQKWYLPGDLVNQFAAQRQTASRAATSLFGRETIELGKHELTRNARIAAQWGERIDHRLPAIHLDDAASAAANEQIRAWRAASQWFEADSIVGLMPAASMPVKKYPPSCWAIALSELWRRHRIVGAIVGGPSDTLAIDEVSARLGKLPHLRLSQPLDILGMAALIGSLDGFLTVDTGLAHLALAQDVPTVVLCGGGDPGRFFPWPIPRKAVILNHSMPCEGCNNRCHLARSECITRIDPMEIVRATVRLIRPEVAKPLRIAG
jgi:ADP-heptose:LPS heptosyltransferase